MGSKETRSHGRGGFSVGAHSLGSIGDLQFTVGEVLGVGSLLSTACALVGRNVQNRPTLPVSWEDSLPNFGFIFLMSRFKSTRVSGNVIIRLGGRAMKFSGPKMSFSLIWGSRPIVPMVSFKETIS